MEMFVQLLTDFAVGVLATFTGGLLVFALFAPRIRFDQNVRLEPQYDPPRFRIRYRNRGFTALHDVRVRAWVLIPGQRRSTRIPVPLSTDEVQVFQRNRKVKKWKAPRLLLEEIQWSRFLPPDSAPPADERDLAELLTQYQATLRVSVSASTALFSLRTAVSTQYGPADILQYEVDGDQLDETSPETRSESSQAAAGERAVVAG